MWSTTEMEKDRLARFVSGYATPRVLEIGAFQGETTRVIASAAMERGGRVVVIDPMRWAAEVVHNGIARHVPAAFAPLLTRIDRMLGRSGYETAFWANLGRCRDAVDLRRTVSTDPALVADPDPALAAFDVVFIDGDHSQAGALADLRNWGRRVVPGGVLLVHDAVPAFPGVIAALKIFAAERGLTVEWPTEASMATIRIPAQPDAAKTPTRAPEVGASFAEAIVES